MCKTGLAAGGLLTLNSCTMRLLAPLLSIACALGCTPVLTAAPALPAPAEFIRVSSTYGRIKASIIEQMCRALIFSQQAQPDSVRVAEAIRAYDALWAEWRKLRADHPDTCPTLYTDKAFRGAPGMGASIDRLR